MYLPILSTASLFVSGLIAKYLSVVLTSEWANNACIVLISTPSCNSHVPNVCLRSWKVKLVILAFNSAAFTAFFSPSVIIR